MSALTLDKEAETSGEPARSDEPARSGEPELTAGPMPSDDFDPAVTPRSEEVAIHELGESLAATVASVQGEMARYNTALGTYVLDEIDISIPVMLRVTKLGQVMARVTDSQTP